MSRRLRLGAVAVWLALWAGAAFGDYKKAYGDALTAARDGDWKQVAVLMRQAIAERSAEGERIRLYGTRFEVYLPHFYLGQALAETGDCAGALKELQLSEDQGAVKSTDRYVELQRLRSRCQRALPEPTRPAAPPTPDLGAEIRRSEAEVNRATEIEKAVADLRRSAAPVWQERPALAARADQAINKLGNARNALTRGKTGSAGDLAQAATLAGEAIRELEAVRSEVTSRQNELRQAASSDQARQDEQRRQEEARRRAAQQELANLLKATENVAVGPAGARVDVRQAMDALQRARTRASGLAASATADEVLAAKTELQNAERTLRERLALVAQTPSPPPPQPTAPGVTSPTSAVPTAGPAAAPPLLRQAAGRYLAADYQGVLDLLRATSLAEPRAAAAVALLRAASSWALFVEEGESDRARLQAAQADVLACKRLEPSLGPDPGLFPPGFVELFQQTR